MWLLYEDFIYLLRDEFHRWPWWITMDGEIRTERLDGEELDPLTAMVALAHHRFLDVGSYPIAARYLGLGSEDADAIAQASDLAGSYNAHVRADLIDALHLEEQWGREGRWEDLAFTAHAYPHGYDQPFRRGSGSAGFASAAARRERISFTSAPPRLESPWKSRVYIADIARSLWITSVCREVPPASSSGFSVGTSQPGFQLLVDKARAA